MPIISIIVSIILLYITYEIFQSFGFKPVLVIRLLLIIAFALLKKVPSFWTVVGIGCGLSLITTAIEYAIIKKTSSFISWLIISALIEAIIVGSILSILEITGIFSTRILGF